MLITISEDTLTLSPGNTVIFRGQKWEDYERLLNLRQETSIPKLSFNLNNQEIRLMSPLPSHGKRIDLLRNLVRILLEKKGLDWECFDPITLTIQSYAGVEPDTCFYINNRQAMLGKNNIDLTVDPAPDLAIEVDFTSITDISAYEMIKVPELWIYRQGVLNIYILEDNKYQDSAKSRLFPDFDIKTILPQYVELGWNEGSSVALRQFRNL